jgi:hypothetical protein
MHRLESLCHRSFYALRVDRKPMQNFIIKKPGDLTYPLSPRFGGRGLG